PRSLKETNMNETERQRLLIDVLYSINQLRRHRDISRALDALERVAADLAHPPECADVVDLGRDDGPDPAGGEGLIDLGRPASSKRPPPRRASPGGAVSVPAS